MRNGPLAMSSVESVPTEFYASLQASGVDNLLEFLAKKPDSELRLKNLQRDEPDLTFEEKIILLRSKLESNPEAFLSQLGHHFQSSHLECFSLIRKHNYEVDFHLKQMEKSLTPAKKKILAKNRRYEALQRLVDTTDYFTEEEMQRRNPILFEQLIGRYHTKEEREAFLFQSSKSSSSGTKSGESRPTPLTDMLIAHMNRSELGNFSERRVEQENQVDEERMADEEYQEDGMEEDEEDGPRSQACAVDEDGEEIEDEEKDVLKSEFFTSMYRSFLEGKDEDFDYAAVDTNPEYDCGETLDQDEEEKYFEASEENECECEENVNPQPEQPTVTDDQVPGPSGEVESEDELDAYMKGIQREVDLQNKFTRS